MWDMHVFIGCIDPASCRETDIVGYTEGQKDFI